MERNWTKEQSQAIFGRGGSILVSAAAGSGKTAVLVERVIQKLTDPEHPVDADRLLIATFSNAAAGEMRDRIAAAIGKRLAEHPENALLRHQQLLLQKATIGTIHSFCLELIRQHFDQLGLDAKFQIADETQLADLRGVSMEELLEERYSQSDPDFLTLCEWVCGKTDRPLQELILAVYDFLRSHPFPDRWMEESLAEIRRHSLTREGWSAVLWDSIGETLRHAGELLSYGIAQMEDDPAMKAAYGPAFAGDQAGLASLASLWENGDWDGLYHGVRNFAFPRLGQLRNYEDAEKKEQVSGLRKEVKKLLSDLAARQLCSTQEEFAADMERLFPVAKALFQAVERFGEILSQRKKEKRVLDFSDLEHNALALLGVRTPQGVEQSPLALELSQQYDEIMLDEYQDTNEIQDAIFGLLSRREKNLFMVGDVKQSIYRFRQARPELFLRRREQYPPYDGAQFPCRVILGKNFRSRPQVADAVNFFFTQLMSRKLGEVDYGIEEALDPAGSFVELEDREPEIHLIEPVPDSQKPELDEPRYVARMIANMLAQGYPVQEDGRSRPCRCGDFCILLRASKKAEQYLEALKEEGISGWADSTAGYMDSQEIAVMVNLLRIIDNPLQDIPLLSVLMSPMFRFTPDEIGAIRLRDKKVSFYAALLETAKEGNSRTQGFLEVLSQLRTDSAVLSADKLLRKIYDTTDFMAVVGAMPSGAQKQANLRLLLEYAARYEAIGSSGLSGFLRFLDRASENGADFVSANVISENADVVRIMTIHRSKGLEFPICILADCGKRFHKEDLNASYLLHAELGFSMKIREPERLKAYTTLRQEALRLQLEGEALSEEMRVLYVAMTRAKEKLIMTMTAPGLPKKLQTLSLRLGAEDKLSPFGVRKGSCYGDWLLMAALRHPDGGKLRKLAGAEFPPCAQGTGKLKIFLSSGGAEPVPAAQEKISFSAQPTQREREQLLENLSYRYPYRALSQTPAKLSVTQIVHGGGRSASRLKERPSFLLKKGLTPAQRGTIVHRFIQFADYAAAREDLLSEMERLMVRGFLTREEIASLPVGELEPFFQSAFMGRILAADQVMREYRFFDEIPAGQIDPALAGEDFGETVLVQGIADCILVEQGQAVIIDYKTDRVSRPEELRERYEPQLYFYKNALEKALELPVKECILYSVYLNREIVL